MEHTNSSLNRLRHSLGYRLQHAGQRVYGQAAVSEQEALTRESLNALAVARLLRDDVGAQYSNVNRQVKEELVSKLKELNEQIPSATSWINQTILATEILSVPANVIGDVVECGSWKGA